MARVLVLLGVLLALASCQKPGAPVAQDAGAGPDIVPAGILRSVCQHEPCGGDRPVVNVYRDAKGNVARLYRLYGSCSHSPGLYFEPNGTLADTIPEKPITVGSPEALALEQRHDKQVGGLSFTDVIRCSDGKRLPPPAPGGR